MGIKSTIELTRKEAEERMARKIGESAERHALITLKNASDKNLEEWLEQAEDLDADREGTTNFDNYLIIRGDD